MFLVFGRILVRLRSNRGARWAVSPWIHALSVGYLHFKNIQLARREISNAGTILAHHVR